MDPAQLLDIEKRTGVKDDDIDDFLRKVTDVQSAIQDMAAGRVDPKDVRVEGIKTAEELEREREEAARRREELKRKQVEKKARQKREEHETWWRYAELSFGPRDERMALVRDPLLEPEADAGAGADAAASDAAAVEAARRERVRQAYESDYSRWESFVRRPDDPASLEEQSERERLQEEAKNRAFEAANPDFCQDVMKDMEGRREAAAKKKRDAERLRRKGNAHYAARRDGEALACYRSGLKLQPFDTRLLANAAQACIRLGLHDDAVDLCDRTLFVDPKHLKARVRRADVLSRLGRLAEAAAEAAVAAAVDPMSAEAARRRDAYAAEARDAERERRVEAEGRRTAELLSTLETGDAPPTPAAAGPPPRPDLAALDLLAERLAGDGAAAAPGARGAPAALEALERLLRESADARVRLRSSGLLRALLRRLAAEAPGAPRAALLRALSAACAGERRSAKEVLGAADDLRALVAALAADVEGGASGGALAAAAALLRLLCEEDLCGDDGPRALLGDAACAQDALRCLVRAGAAADASDRSSCEDLARLLGGAALRATRPQAPLRRVAASLLAEARDPPMAVALCVALERSPASAHVAPLCAAAANASRHEAQRPALAAAHALLERPPVATLLRVVRGEGPYGGASMEAKEYALAALWNGCAGAGAGAQANRRCALEHGGLAAFFAGAAACAGLRGASDPAILVRCCGLIGRLAGEGAAAQELAGPKAFPRLAALLERCSQAPQRAVAWETAAHLAKAMALALERAGGLAQGAAEGSALLEALCRLMPAPRGDPMRGGSVSASSVALQPADGKAPPGLVAHVAKCLASLVAGEGAAEALCRCGAPERIVCALANYEKDGEERSARKNVAILLAKLVRASPAAMARVRELRGMEMLVQLGRGLC